MLQLSWDDEPGRPGFLLCCRAATAWPFIERMRAQGYTGPFRFRHMELPPVCGASAFGSENNIEETST